jgi:hypothetical protein
MDVMNLDKNVNMIQGVTPMNDLLLTLNNHMIFTRTMPMRIKNNLTKMMNVANAYHLHHRNDVIVMAQWLMTMAYRVRMTLMNKDVTHVILQGHVIKIMTMRTITNNPFLNKSYLLNMILVLVKNSHMIVHNTTAPSQVIASQANTMVMDSTEGDVDVHSHVVAIVTTMMT